MPIQRKTSRRRRVDRSSRGGWGWAAAGVLGLAGCPAALASPLTFTTVIHADSALGGTSDTLFRMADQVVLQDGGRVAVLAQVEVSLAQRAAVLYTPTGHDATLVVAEQGASTWGAGTGGTHNFFSFSNLALTGNAANGSGTRLTFSTLAGPGAQDLRPGIFQYDPGSATPQARVMLNADTLDGQSFSFSHPFPVNAVSLQVNSRGQVLFGGQAGGQVLARGDGAAAVKPLGIGAATNYNESLPAAPYVKRAITSTGSAVFLNDLGNAPPIMELTAGGALNQRVPGTQLIGAGEYSPRLLMGATPSTILYQAAVTGADKAIVWTDGSSYQILGGFSETGTLSATGELSQNGKAAVFVPDASGGTLRYFDGSLSTVASVGLDLGDSLEIKQLSVTGQSTPMINSNGLVVFDAKVGESGNAGDSHEALLAWRPGMNRPVVIVKTGETMTINGQSRTVGWVNGTVFSPWSDGDVFKDGLSEDNKLAFAVNYDDGWDAVMLTDLSAIPEPASGAMVLLAGAGVLMSRRRAR